MRSREFTDEQFLRLWGQHGVNWTWKQYADALSDLLGLEDDDRIPPLNVRVRVNRNRDRWAAEHGVYVAPRQVKADMEFASWPQLPRAMRNQALYRVLEYAGAARIKGLAKLDETNRERYLRARRNMKKKGEVIRYDPGRPLYRSKRNANEIREDPDHERLYESRASYLERNPE